MEVENGQNVDSQELSEYNSSHRLFMQAMLSHRILEESRAEEIYDNVCVKTNVDKNDFSDFIAVINKEINDVDFALRRSVDQYNSVAIIALVNTKSDEAAKLATTYTPNELAYFKRILELIITADNEAYSISSIAAIREGPRLKSPISQRESEWLLAKLVKDQWLKRRTDGYYVLHMRSIIELQDYMKETFEDDVHECLMCMEIVTIGERCSQERCSVRLHLHCAAGYFPEDENGAAIKCPTCSTSWKRSNKFGGANTPRRSNGQSQTSSDSEDE